MESLHFIKTYNIEYSDVPYFEGIKSNVNEFINSIYSQSCFSKNDFISFDHNTVAQSDLIEISKNSFRKMMFYLDRLQKNEIVLLNDDNTIQYTAAEMNDIFHNIYNNASDDSDLITLTWF